MVVQRATREIDQRFADYPSRIAKMEESLLELRRKAAKRPTSVEVPALQAYDRTTNAELRIDFGIVGNGVEAYVTLAGLYKLSGQICGASA